VRNVGAHLGRAVTSDQTVGTGSGELWVSIAPGADYDATLRSIGDVVTGYPGVRGTVLNYENERSAGVLGPKRNAIVVRVYGQELPVLHRKAEELRRLLAVVPGVRDPRVRAMPVQPTLQIEPDLAAARRYGVKPGDVRRASAVLVSGLEVGSFFEAQKVFQVVVRGVPAVNRSLTSVRNLLVDTPGGGHVRLADVARVRIQPNPVDIRHDAVSRYAEVRADVRGRGLADVEGDVQRRLQDVRFPLEYHAELVPAPSDEQGGQSFLNVAIASALGVFLLLQAAFASWRIAALLFLALPFALVGGVLAAFAGGDTFSLGELVGLFAVFGIATRNGIVLIARAQELEREEGGAFSPALVLRAARERLAPITASATTTALAVLPLALIGDVAGNEITHSTAVVIIGGLVTATLLNLLVVPALYLHSGARAARRAAAAPRVSSAPSASPTPSVDLPG